MCEILELEDTIRSAGLAQTKAKRIKDILDLLHERHGRATLEHMRDMATEDIKAELRQ
jgi:endonuclease III